MLAAVGANGQVYQDDATEGQGSGWSGWGSMGGPSGVKLTHVTAAYYTNGAGNLMLAADGANGQVYQDDATEGQGSGWSGWGSMGGPSGVKLTHVTAAYYTNGAGNLMLAADGANGQVYQDDATEGQGSGWSGWGSMGGPGGVKLTHVTAAYYTNGAGNLMLAADGANGQVYQDDATEGQGSGWSGWGSMGGPGGVKLTHVTAAYYTNGAGNLMLAADGANGQVYQDDATEGQGSGWSGWGSMGGPGGVKLTHVTAAYYTNGAGNLMLAADGANGQVYQDDATEGQGSGWSGWGSMGGPGGVKLTHVTAAYYTNGAGNLMLAADGANGQVYQDDATEGQGSGWSGWGSMGGPSGVKLTHVTAAYYTNGAGNLMLAAVGANGQVYQDDATEGQGSGWSGWGSMGSD